MKYVYKFFSAVVLMAIAFTGCVKEQSSFQVSDIPGKATIMGSYHYNAGQDYDYDQYIQVIKPLANHVVYAQLSNSSLKSGSTGYTVYETVTDANGQFKIEVPATLEGVTVEVYPKPFIGKHSAVVGVEYGEPVIESTDVVYVAEHKTWSVKTNDIKFHDALCNVEGERKDADDYPYTWTFTATVGEATYSKSWNEADKAYEVKKAYTMKNNIDVYATIKDTKLYDKELLFVATTNSNGVAKFVIPAKEPSGSTTVKFVVKPYVAKSYKYYKKELNNNSGEWDVNVYYISEGSFDMWNGSSVVTSISKSVTVKDLEGVTPHDTHLRMVFTPFDTVEETYSYSNGEWNGLDW